MAKKAGREVIGQALRLYYIAADSDTPVWAKSTIYGSLAYFVLPIDVIPDVVPILGYSDDVAVLAAAFKAVTSYYKKEHGELADRKLADWFD